MEAEKSDNKKPDEFSFALEPKWYISAWPMLSANIGLPTYISIGVHVIHMDKYVFKVTSF